MKNTFEATIGSIILFISVLFIFQFIRINNINVSEQLKVFNATFKDITGISVGSDVRISGVKVGLVKRISFDEKKMKANIEIGIKKSINIPIDSVISVSSNGIFGSKFLSISPGFEDEFITDNGIFQNTTSSLNLEDLVSKFAAK